MEKRMRPLYQAIAGAIAARLNCIASGNEEWEARHAARIEELVKSAMPSGSGIDAGTQISLAKSTGERLVFHTAFHHMDECGGYDGWTEHDITVRPSLYFGVDLRISGRNRNEIKDYLHEVFCAALTGSVEEFPAPAETK